jgi:hypothetical protein
MDIINYEPYEGTIDFSQHDIGIKKMSSFKPLQNKSSDKAYIPFPGSTSDIMLAWPAAEKAMSGTSSFLSWSSWTSAEGRSWVTTEKLTLAGSSGGSVKPYIWSAKRQYSEADLIEFIRLPSVNRMGWWKLKKSVDKFVTIFHCCVHNDINFSYIIISLY